jgi:predicted acyl esterase
VSYHPAAGDAHVAFSLRVDVSSSNFHRYDRNPNTGEPFGTALTTVVAEQLIHHAPGRESRVVLPVVRRA